MYETIKLFLFDVDGVLTDGRIVLDSAGVETKAFDVRDGTAIRWLQRVGVQVGFLTGRDSEVVTLRARELGVDIVHQGARQKLDVLTGILSDLGLRESEIAYMGDDLIDLPVLRRAGVSFAPCDARPEVLELVEHVTRAPGGRGAAREAIEFLLKARGSWDEIAQRYQE